MESLLDLTNLTATQFSICVAVVFIAGMVRGFAGFALSALVMASLAVTLPPVELLPICWMLEFAAGFLMIRGGFKDADKGIAFGLFAGSAIGSPIALYFTNVLPLETSKLIALAIIIVLAILQLAKVRATFLATSPGLYISGFTAGVANGFAGVGGMVVALYVLARDKQARMMRGSLVMFLFMSNILALFYLIAYGMMNQFAITRGLALVLPCLAGVIVGKALFRPSLERYYKPFCLLLLVGLASFGLIRLGVTS